MLKEQTNNDIDRAGERSAPATDGGGRLTYGSIIPYATVALALGLLGFSIFWRRGYIAQGDIWPSTFIPGNNAWHQNWPIWGPTVTGIGSPQFNPTTLVWSFFDHLIGLVNLSGPHQQIVFLVVMLMFQGLAMTYMVRTLYPSRPVAAIIAGLAVPLSLYNSIVFLNPIQAFAFGWFPLTSGVIVRSALKRSWFDASLRIGMLSLGLWVLVGTPPMAVLWMLWVIGWSLFVYRRHKSKIWVLVGALIVSVLLNGWWAYATLLTLGGGSVQQNFASPLAWAWVNQRASLINLLTMRGVWSWPQKIYFPWSQVYEHGVLTVLVYMPFVFALGALLMARRTRSRWVWLGLIVASVSVAQGTHPPVGILNTWLYQHAPYFWLFRDPQVEMGVILYTSLFTLAALGLDEFFQRYFNIPSKSRKATGVVLLSLAFGALLSNGYGIISGQAFARHGTTLGSLNVRVPAYWSQAATFLNKPGRATGRILLLPNDDFYQMPYRWGYYGTDVVAQSYFHAPIVLLNPNPSGYLAPSNGYEATIGTLYSSIKANPSENIGSLLAALGVHWIVERRDINWQATGRTILSAPYISWYLSHQPDIKRVRTIGSLVLYRVLSNSPLITTGSEVSIWSGSAAAPLIVPSSLKGMVASSSPWVQGKMDIPVSEKVQELGAAHVIHNIDVGGGGSLYVRPVTASVRVRYVPGRLIIQLAGLPLQQGHRRIFWQKTRSLAMVRPLPERLALRIGGSLYTIDTGKTSFVQGKYLSIGSYTLPKEVGKTTLTVYRGVPTPLTSSWSPVGNCNAYEDLPSYQTQLWERALGSAGIELHASAQAACSTRATVYSQGAGLLQLNVEFRHVSGSSPTVALTQNNEVVAHTVLPAQHSWQSWDQFVQLGSSGPVHVFTYSFAGQNRSTINDYRVSLTDFNAVKTFNVSLSGEVFTVNRGVIVQHGTALSPNVLKDTGFLEWGPLFNADNYNRETLRQAGISSDVNRGVLTLIARADGAGEGQVVDGLGGHVISVSVEARTVNGQPATVALVNGSNGKAIWSDSIPVGMSGWARLATTIALPQSDNSVDLVLYAYVDGGSPTVTQFRNPQIRTWTPGRQNLWVITGKPGMTQALSYSGSSTQYKVTLSRYSRVVVLHTSYNAHWKIFSGGHPQNWRHVVIDGIFNGWIVPPGVNARRSTITIVFEPEQIYRILWIIALVVLSGIMVISSWTLIRRADRL